MLEGVLWRCGSAGPHRGDSSGSSSLGRSPLAWTLLEVTTHLTRQPPDLRDASLEARKSPERECNPDHQQVLHWNFTGQGPAHQSKTQFFTTSSFHLEAYTSLLASSIRGQTDRRKKNHSTTATKTNATLKKVEESESESRSVMSDSLQPLWTI